MREEKNARFLDNLADSERIIKSLVVRSKFKWNSEMNSEMNSG